MGFDGERPRDAEALLLPPRERESRFPQAVLHFVPQRSLAQGALDRVLQGRPVVIRRETQAVGDVVEDRLGKRVGLLEHHPDVAADHDRIDIVGIDVLPLEQHASLDVRSEDAVVHPVERPEERALSAPTRPDESSHLVLMDVQRRHVERLLRSVANREIDRLHLDDCLGRRRLHCPVRRSSSHKLGECVHAMKMCTRARARMKGS